MFLTEPRYATTHRHYGGGLIAAAACITVAWPVQAQSASDVSLVWTNFLGASLSGPADRTPRIGGRVDLWATLDGQDAGLWKGLTVNVRPELIYGNSVNGQGSGEILPINTALAFPTANAEDFDVSLTIGQRIGKSQLTIGKINTVDLKIRTPLLGGGGLDGFQFLQFAAPITLFTPPRILGALLTMPIAGASVTVGAWDPRSMLNQTGFEKPLFGTGVNGMVSVAIPVSIAGRRGYQNILLSGTTTRGTDLSQIPDLTLPPTRNPVIGTRKGGWLIRYGFQQYLWTDASNPKRGWGLFGDVTLWDSNPTPLEWGMSLGVTGEPGFTGGRADDRFGVGYYRFSVASDLVDALDPLLKLGAEQGVEAFYTFTINPNTALTAAVQHLDPARSDRGNSLHAGLRLRVRL
jgi:porin